MMTELFVKGGKRGVMLALFLMLAMITFAVPAKPGLKRVLTLANGTTVSAVLVGDEHGHFWKGADGKAYQMVPGKDVYQEINAKEVIQRAQQKRAKANQRRTKRMAPRKVGDVGSIIGDKKGIIILVNFKDQSFTATQSDFNKLANQVNYNSGNYKGSMYDYFYAQSEGQFRLTFDVVGPYTVSQNYSYYGENGSSAGDDKHPAEMVIEALELANADVNFADYDWDGDGEVEQVYVVYAGKGEADGGDDDTIWPHEYDLYSANYYGDGAGKQKLDGVWINTYACGGEKNGQTGATAGIGTMCHEFSHCLGYPDFYDTDYSGGQGMGYWDLMDSGSYNGDGYRPAGYTSYERWVAGWKTPTELVNTQTISNMKALQTTGSDTYIIYNKGNNNEYYLLENRQKTGWDASLPGAGLLILHVDYSSSAWTNNTPNDDPSHQRMTWIPADNKYQYTTYQGTKYYTEEGAANDPFPYGNINAFGKNTTPAATLYNNNSDGTKYLDSSIENITQNSNGTISFNFVGISNVATPTFSPAAGHYDDAQTVTISCETSGVTIYYTLDGTTPTTSSNIYSSALTISETTTVKAMAVKDSEQSAVATAKYTIGPATNTLIFEKVTSTDQLEADKRYLIVYETGSLALSTAQNKYRDGQAVTISSNTIDLSSTDDADLPSILTLGGSSSGWTFYDGSTYLGLSSNENALHSLSSGTSNNAKWTVSISSGVATITNVAYDSRVIKYNTGSPRFACYTSGQQSVALYVEQEVTTPAEPVIAADESLVFSTTVGTPQVKELEVLSEGLTEDITLTLTDDNNVFSLSSNTISKSVSDATVNVTFTPTAAGEYTGSITLSSAGADPVTVQLTATATESTTPVDPTQGGTVLLYEGLSKYNSANDGTQAIEKTYQYLDYSGWNTLTKIYAGGTNNAYSNGGCLKFGSSSAAGSMTSGSIALTGTGTLTFYLKKYGSDTGKLNVSVTGATADVTQFTPASDWTLCTVNLTNATGTVNITLATSAKRAYVDEITLTSGSGGGTTTTVAAPVISGTTPFTGSTTVTITAESGASIYYTLDGSTPTSSSTQYSEPFQLTATTTVKAIAVKDNVSSSVTMKEFERTPNYYEPADGYKGEALKTAMFNIIKTHTTLSYTNLTTYYEQTDKRADGKVRDWYSNATNYDFSQCSGTYSGEGDMYNKEHSFPDSWFNEASPMHSDIVHVVPADGYVNNRRSNNILAKVGTATYTSANGYSKLGTCATEGYNGTVFEPNNEVKGDLARIYFYMVTCYQDKITSWTNTTVKYILDGQTYPGYQSWYLDMLKEWSRLDPIDDVERARNNAVYTVQGNRNPFVDYPGLEEYIWGFMTDATFSYDNYVPPVYKEDVTMSFSPATATATLGEDFTEPTLTTTPSGLTVTYSSSTPSVATVDSSTGEVTLVAAGETTITATFAGNDSYNSGTASYTLTVNAAQALPNAPTGLTLSDVASTSMSASWSAVANATSYEIDVVQGSSFEASAGEPVLQSNFTSTTGWTLSGTGTYTGAGYYGAASPSIKFDGTGDYAISPDFGSGVKLQFWAFGNNGSGSTFKISGFVNNAWTDIETVAIAQGGDTYEVNLPAGTSKVRFDFTKSVNCALDDVVIYGPSNNSESLDGYPKSVGNVTSTSITGLTPETQYAVRVRAVNDAGNGEWSSTATATTTVGNSAPVLTVPQTSYAVTAGDPDVNFTVTVTGVPEPTVTATCTEGAYFVFENNEFLFETNDVGTYHFVFTATNSEGSDSKTVTIVVSPAPVTIPELTVSDVTSNSAAASWTECDNVTTYTLQLASDDQFTESSAGGEVTLFSNDANSTTAPYDWTYNIANTTGSYLQLTSSSNYVVSEAVDASNCSDLTLSYKQRTYGGTSGNSNVVLVQYSTNNGTSWTDLGTTTAANTTLTTKSVDVSAAAGLSSVRFRLSVPNAVSNKGCGISTIVLTGTESANDGSLISTQTVNGTSYTFTGLTPETTYYARVKGDDGWSNVESFITTNPVLSLANDADNTAAISAAAASGKMYDVILQGRTLWKDGAWNTLVLPFDVTIADSPLAGDGVTVMEMNAASSGIEGSTMTLNFTPVTTMMTAGKPYIIKWNNTESHITNPTFNNVTITASTPTDVESIDFSNSNSDGFLFKGLYAPLTIASGGDNTKLYLSTDNKLYYPNGTMTIGAFRAYFQLAEGLTVEASNGNQGVKDFILNFGDEATAIGGELIMKNEESDGTVYDLSGRRVNSEKLKVNNGGALPKGIYIVNGRKVVIK